MNTAIILVLNCGSSSLKFGLYRLQSLSTASTENEISPIEVLLTGEVEPIGISEVGVVEASINIVNKEPVAKPLAVKTINFSNHKEAILHVVRLLAESSMPAPVAIGHRVVHGGFKLREHCLIDDGVIKQLEAASTFAPLHNYAALLAIRITQALFPHLPQVACFDTTFHLEMPEIASVLPISKILRLEGIRRYGFHGLSYESIVQQLGKNIPRRLVIAHLGNGASVTAVKNGKSIDTSMGMTPTGGIMMGTRSGDIDPGVLIYLMHEKRFDAAMLENLVDHQSGLLGISGIDSDMRHLHEAAKSNSHAQLAIQMFCYAVQKQIAAMISVLNGIDMLVFTGGIGENDSEIRTSICKGLAWFGIKLDESKNRSADDSNASQSTNGSAIDDTVSCCKICVITSNEDEQIARHTLSLIKDCILS